MLHAIPSASAPPKPPLVDPEVARARAYIDAARSCGLVIFPWPCRDFRGGGFDTAVGLTGREMDGPNDYSEGTLRLMRHPDGRAAKGCRKGLVFELLCADFGLKPEDPDFHAKVNATIVADLAQVAS